MKDFTVDGILCRVDRRLGIGHTGFAPFCYDGDVVVESSDILQVYAEKNGKYVNIQFKDTDPNIVERFTKCVRRAFKRTKK